MADSCSSCRFFKGHEYGNCLRHAPARTVDNADARWPLVSADAWCGEFESAAVSDEIRALRHQWDEAAQALIPAVEAIRADG